MVEGLVAFASTVLDSLFLLCVDSSPELLPGPAIHHGIQKALQRTEQRLTTQSNIIIFCRGSYYYACTIKGNS